MLNQRVTILIALLIGVGLESGIQALTGHREAWGSPQYLTVGMPIALVASALLGYMSRETDWIWAALVVPGQVITMMVESPPTGNLWPLTVIFSAILSTPFVVASFLGSRFRPRPRAWR